MKQVFLGVEGAKILFLLCRDDGVQVAYDLLRIPHGRDWQLVSGMLARGGATRCGGGSELLPSKLQV